MGASAEYLAAAPIRREVEPAREMLSWGEAFLMVERLVGQGRQSATVSFARGVMEVAVSSGSHASRLKRLSLRPQPCSRRLSRIFRPGASPRFSATTFVPGLLTFLDRQCRIALVANDRADVEALRADLAAHAPWHQFLVRSPASAAGEHFDIVITDMETSPASLGGGLSRLQHGGLLISAGALFPRRGLSARSPAFRPIFAGGSPPIR